MQKLVREYLNELKSRQKKQRRTGIAFMLLVVMVVGMVGSILTQYGVAMTGGAKCQTEEHAHGEACYEERIVCGLEESAGHTHAEGCYVTESQLVCGLEETEEHIHEASCYAESQSLVCGTDESAGHIHDASCYESQIVCGITEHSHTEECYIDIYADVEDAGLWDAQYAGVEWTDAWGEDLETAARMQVGYKESTDNYMVAEDGSHKGYTRYGQFSGDVYVDWDAALVNFCVYYTGLKGSNLFPDEKDTAKWCEEFGKINEQNGEVLACLTGAEGYEPEAGDILFFDRDGEERTNQMGIVSSYNKEKNEIKVIEGNSGNEVKENTYDAGDAHIVRYLKISELEKVYKGTGEEAQDAEEVQPVEAPAEETEAVQTDEVKEEGNPEGEDTEGKESEEKQEQDEEGQLSEEELSQVDEVIALIDDIPSPEEIQEKMEALEDDEEEYEKYYLKLQKQVMEAFEAYEALSEAQQEKVTNAEKLLQMDWMKAETLDESDKKMGPDEAYVNSISVTSMTTGTAPWDEKEGRGNDVSASDTIVRTYDTVTYNFSVNMKTWDIKQTFNDARIKLEFVLPRTEGEAVFDQSAMTWMDNTSGYEPKLTQETRSIDGEEKECQVLTCYKHLLPAEGSLSVVPGDFGENLTIYVKSMHNGEKFQPIISAAMEGGTWEGECDKENHKINGVSVIEKKTVVPEEVEVTAAPKYNIKLESEKSYRGIFDFQGDDEWMQQYGNIAANTDISTPIPGRLMKLGIVLQLYNDNLAKGLKGIELPEGPISFDLNVSSAYTPTAESEEGTQYDTTEEYTPLLWSYGENREIKYGENNTDGRVLYDNRACTELAPYFEHDEAREGSDCKDSGTWKASQEGSTIHITVSDYTIDLEHMPTKNIPGGTDLYGSNIGCFSSGGIWLVQPFNKRESNTETEGPEYDIIKDKGAGAFATTAKAGNLQATTVGGETLIQGQGDFDQMVLTDDEEVRTLELNLPGSMQNRVRYAGDHNRWWLGSGVDDIYDGNDYAAKGSELYLVGGFSYDSQKDAGNQLYLGTNLIRFYGSAIELNGEGCSNLIDGASLDGKTGESMKTWWEPDPTKSNIRIYYATKKDGKDWDDYNELKYALEEDLKFYDSLDKIPEDSLCVGILTCFVGPGPEPDKGTDNGSYYYYHQAHVKDEQELVGKSFALVSTSRVWTKEMFEEAELELEDIHLGESGEVNIRDWVIDSELWKNDHYKSANIGGSTFYVEETYKANGSGPNGTHNSEWEHWGDTLLVIGYRTKITKNLMQTDINSEEKKNYNLDSGQRVADFKLQPVTYYEKQGDYDHTDDITIVDILPEYMTYKPGSAYFGGIYEQSSEDGGTKGTIIKDTSEGAKFPDPVLTEPQVTNNEDGTQTLTWVIKDVKIGEAMAPIYYSVDIGDSGNPEKDVPIGSTSLENVAYIKAPGDLRDPLKTAEKNSKAGLSVNRGSASSFGKYTKQKIVDEDGEIDYVVYYNNNADTETSFTIMDTMPMNGENGSEFTGTYTFEGWKLDTTRCDLNQIKIYYTFDEQYKNKTADDLNEGEMEGWKEAVIELDGTIKVPKPDPDTMVLDGEKVTQMHPVAWGVIGELGSKQSIYIDLKVKLDPGPSAIDKEKSNYFVNLLSKGDTTTITETPTVRRTLEGLTWIDDNRDGIQDKDEMRLSGVNVELLKLKEGGNAGNESDYEAVCYPDTDTPVSIETGHQISIREKADSVAAVYEPGRYKFIDLPKGTFAVRFSEGSSKIHILEASPENQGGDDTVDSDGTPTYSDDNKDLEKTLISDIRMPAVEELAVTLFESKYHDSGFYCGAEMGITKNGVDGQLLAGVRFKLADFNDDPVQIRKQDEDGYFVVRDAGTADKEWILDTDEEGNYQFRNVPKDSSNQDLTAELSRVDLLQTASYSVDKQEIHYLDAAEQFIETDANGKIKVNGLLPGNYTISEIQTAAGYQLLEKPIKIKIGEDGVTTVTNLNELDSDVNLDDDNKLAVRNHPLYALPSTGGMGIYWYMFGGVLLMSAAAFITYRNKRREVLRS